MTTYRQERRIRVVNITTRFFFDVVKHGLHGPVNILQGMPEDAELIEIHYDFLRDCFAFLVGSATFDPVPPGHAYPEIEVIFERVKR